MADYPRDDSAQRIVRALAIDPSQVRVLLCDADGNLFPSEEPAFHASARVTNAFLAAYGLAALLTAEDLRRETTGKNFRTAALELCLAHGVPVDPELSGRERTSASPYGRSRHGHPPALTRNALEHWVQAERNAVTTYLAKVLAPDPAVLGPLTDLARDPALTLAAVSSSASSRLDACFTATGLDALIPRDRRYSAEDSLPKPTSKPDPAVYLHAGRELGCAGAQGLAIEDSVPGAQAAVAAGFPTIGNLMFVPSDERAERAAALEDVGVARIVTSWDEVVDICRT